MGALEDLSIEISCPADTDLLQQTQCQATTETAPICVTEFLVATDHVHENEADMLLGYLRRESLFPSRFDFSGVIILWLKSVSFTNEQLLDMTSLFPELLGLSVMAKEAITISILLRIAKGCPLLNVFALRSHDNMQWQLPLASTVEGICNALPDLAALRIQFNPSLKSSQDVEKAPGPFTLPPVWPACSKLTSLSLFMMPSPSKPIGGMEVVALLVPLISDQCDLNIKLAGKTHTQGRERYDQLKTDIMASWNVWRKWREGIKGMKMVPEEAGWRQITDTDE